MTSEMFSVLLTLRQLHHLDDLSIFPFRFIAKEIRRGNARKGLLYRYSHSMVAGGLLEMS